MKKNTVYKILKLFTITLLFSCSFYSKSNNTEAISELQQNSIEIKNSGIGKTENLKNIQNLQQNQLLNNEKEMVIKNFTQRLNENEKLIQKIGPNISIFAPKINKDVLKIEPIDQFRINKNTFPENTQSHILNLTLKDNQIRRLFYSSLDYNENKIKKLISILEQASSSTGYHYNVIGLIFWTGFKTQESFEKAVNLLTKNEQRRLMFNFDTKTVKDIQEKFEKLMQNRNDWIKTVEKIIDEYDNNIANVKADGMILGEMLRLEYEHKLNPDESMRIANDIETLLKACCDHTHY
ncbi:complement regulator-acquiring protein [Borreliella afzelii]|uniref:P35 surface antigen n=1 Tax=Borreliella afzelii (strain PKo) TaxID=390236 RepID=Q0SLT5_BORAP|nr:antigen, P35, putative [Borreliella afzelii PKo]AEL70687.1 putative p35 surface antigen [Borreliella afzelii PKo]AJY72883.1 putative p35 surface antigen [Borreliella afzelii K78]